MSFSSLLEEANNTLDSDSDVGLTQWSLDSNSNPLPSPQPSFIKQEPHYTSIKQESGYVPNPEYAHGTVYGNTKHFSSYDVRTEPNPYYQNGAMHNHINQFYQQPIIQQRTHLPVQYDEYYNMNSLPKHDFIVNTQNSQNLYHLQKCVPSQNILPQGVKTPNLLPQNIKTEKSRKRSNKKAEPRKKIKIEYNGPPPNWRPVYENLMEMRKNIIAPVDVMGCFKNAESDRGPKIYRYQVMISLMLSSQTKDEVTAGAMSRLKKFGLTPKHIADADESVLAGLIHPVGFWQKKATYIKNASRIVHTEHDDDIPSSVDGLTSLPGIGPKMAHLCMEFAWNKLTGISVDTHVHRICQRLGWTPDGLRHPDDTRKLLEHWLPKEEWGRINLMMVGFGQVVCLPTKPRCFECKNQTMCPYALNNPDRTCKKTLNTTKPSARNQKYVKQQQQLNGQKSELKSEMKPEQHNSQPPFSSTSAAMVAQYNPLTYYSPGLRPCESVPRVYAAEHYPANLKLDLRAQDTAIYHTLTPTSSPLSAPYLNGNNGNHSNDMQCPGFIKTEPIDDMPQRMSSNNAPCTMTSPMSCIQSPMIDTTTSPLINPLNTTLQKLSDGLTQPGQEELGNSDKQPGNVLENFLDW